MAFGDNLHQASWRGLPFGVEGESAQVGRRVLPHEYPYRDTTWPEDQGKRSRQFKVRGFLIGNSTVYGGGEVGGQRDAMEDAADGSSVPGILVHPTKGRLTVTCLGLVTTTRWDDGNIVDLEFSFLQGGTQVFPLIGGALGDLLGKAAGLADSAGLSAFSSAVLGPLKNGVSGITSLVASASEWSDKIGSLARDATSLYGTVSQLGGGDFGRYFNGRNAGFLAGLVSPYAGAGSVGDLINLGAAKRADISGAAAAVKTSISQLGIGGTPADVASKVQATVAALQASAADPADGVRMLADLAAFAPSSPSAKAAAGTALSDVYQRATAAAIARTSATYAPSSADDAHAVRDVVLGPIEAVIARAGATGEDSVFQAFRGLRKTVVEDLGARGGDLSRLVDVATPLALPSVVLAQRQYVDPTRAGELVTQADPPHPWFMPTRFRALAN